MWPEYADVLFANALEEYDKQTAFVSVQSAIAQSPYPTNLHSRNEFIVKYLHSAGLECTEQQAASHIQQLKKRPTKQGQHPHYTSLPSFSHRSSFTSTSAVSSGSYPDHHHHAAYYISSPPLTHFSPNSSHLPIPTTSSNNNIA